MKRSEILFNAIGDVGADLLREAEERPKRGLWLRWGAVAACLALVLCILPWLLSRGNADLQIPDFGVGGEDPDIGDIIPNMPGASTPLEVGARGAFSYGYLSYQSYEPGRVTIRLDKTDDRVIHWRLYGHDIRDTWTDENGKPAYDMDTYYASTDPAYSRDGQRVENGLAFTVNGVSTDTFPVEPGSYDIVIDYTKLLEMCTEMDVWIISDIVPLYIGVYATSTTTLYEGETLSTDYGTVEYRSAELGKITLRLHKTDEREIGFSLNGATHKQSGETESVTIYYSTVGSIKHEGGLLVENGLRLTVNGQPADALPTAPGDYEIVIDYTGMLQTCDSVYDRLLSDLCWINIPREYCSGKN